VLRRDPDHPGANHYYIHAVEASPSPEQALPSAERLRSLTPGAGHLVHMPAHIYIRTGDFESAAVTNERAAEIDESYIRRTGAKGFYPLMYYTHNLHFIAVSRAEQGRVDQAQAAAERLARYVAPAVQEMPMVEGFLTVPLAVLLRFHRWDDILNASAPAVELPITKAMWHYARAIAFLEKGARQEAERERQFFDAAQRAVPPEAYFGANNTAQNVFQVAAAVLNARFAGTPQERLSYWREAIAVQDSLIYDEPPAWYYPVRESLGGTLLREGQAEAAEAVFREELERNPRNPRALFGLWRSLAAQGKATDAQLVRRQFESSWKNATVELRVEEL
jgi:tetratricopeptide (TPR) repeat protein